MSTSPTHGRSQTVTLGSWGFTGLALIAGLLVTLLEGEGFYGTTRWHQAHRS
jgi:hypothetical protein